MARTGALGAGIQVALVAGISIVLSACAHQAGLAPAGPGQKFQDAATQMAPIRFEDEFVEARLVFQALPLDAVQRPALRAKLIRYLLAPLAPLNVDKLRHESADLASTDVFERVFESLRDAAGLFEPAELWATPTTFDPDERDLLAKSARLALAVYSPRGAEPQIALCLAVLMMVDGQNAEWGERFDHLLSWTDEARPPSEMGLRQSVSGLELLQSLLSDWPAPVVADRLAQLFQSRQKHPSLLIRPGRNLEDARQSLRELLARGQEMQRTLPNVVNTYLRCGRIDRAAQAAAALRDQPGDDPELRDLVGAAQDPNAEPAAFLNLARRYLPPVDLLKGTATDDPDLSVAFRVLQKGLSRSPDNAEMLFLSAQLAKLMSSPFLAIRQLEEAEQILEKPNASDTTSPPLLPRISSDLLDLYFLRLRLALDPERAAAPPTGAVDNLRQRAARLGQKYRDTEIHVHDAQIDFELARSYMNAGQVDQAQPLFQRAQGANTNSASPEITAEFGSFMLKRGDPQQAGRILRDGLNALKNAPPTANRTFTDVESQFRIERLLGDALDVGGDHPGAEQAWRSSATGWDWLTRQYVQRKNFTRTAEAAFEVGRMLYLLGQHAAGILKFEEAIEHDGDRDQTYIDSISFLVQNAELDAALSIYRRALSKPDRSVSEYVKVYSSLWILDLTRRLRKHPDETAETFLRNLDARHPEIRPQRGSAWYRQLAAFAVGRLTYEQLTKVADTSGRKAEVYFYEAMRRLAEGRPEEAHALWKKVIETRMISFFEFDMASRYLRLGAPVTPPSTTPTNTETI